VANTSETTTPAFDVTKNYVRFRELREDGYVDFDFSIGDPQLSVELTMKLADYQSFCNSVGATYLTRAEALAIEFDKCKWRYGLPGQYE
jgi:phenol/toluene 2-monooxygenase (NADH) P0/A0